MLYVQLDTNWPDNPKIIAAGLDGAGLHALVLCLAKRLERDGWVPRAVLYRHGATDDLVGRLVDLELLDAEGEGVRPHDWADRNPSQAAIGAMRASKQEAGRRGNHVRWGHPQPFEDCEHCRTSSQGAIPPDPTAIAEGSHRYSSVSSDSDRTRDRSAIPPATADQRQETLRAAAELIGDRAAAGPNVRNPAAMRRSVAQGVMADRYAEAYRFLATDPTMTPAVLADRLDPGPKPAPRGRLVSDVLSKEPPKWKDGAASLAAIRAERGLVKSSPESVSGEP